jgi:hypothetical protein
MTKNKRIHKRFIVEDDAFAALGRDDLKVGRIKNISLGGLAFEYLNSEPSLPIQFSMIRIFLADDSFHLPDIECKIIRDDATQLTPNHSISAFKKNRCAVRFLSLSDSQKKSLNYFIKYKTKKD